MSLSVTSALNSLTNATTTSATENGEKKSEGDMFMTLLVAQLKNQDPLEPQDGTAFVAQLAQFNSLDQLVNIRQSMEQMVSALQLGQSSVQS